MKEQRELCVRNTKEGTVDFWINYEGNVGMLKNDKQHIIMTYNGESPEKCCALTIPLGNKDDATIEETLDCLMGYISRDTRNWYSKDIVIHWGIHTWKFVNEQNIEKVEKNEYTNNLEDIKLYYDVEW